VEATRDATLAGQLRLYDLILVNRWIDAHTQGNTKLANIYESKFRPEFLPIFKAWLALDPFHNPSAPPGPLFMPQYKLSQEVQADQLDAEAATSFKDGQAAGEQSEDYILNIVFLATVLFLTVIAGRFEWNTVRAVMLACALGLLLFALYHLFTYPIK
jgi:hypothetical protein